MVCEVITVVPQCWYIMLVLETDYVVKKKQKNSPLKLWRDYKEKFYKTFELDRRERESLIIHT